MIQYPSSHVTQLQYPVVSEPVPRQILEELILPASETLYHDLQEVLSRLAIVGSCGKVTNLEPQQLDLRHFNGSDSCFKFFFKAGKNQVYKCEW